MIEQIIKQWEAEWEMRREEFKRRTEDLTDEEKDKEFEIFLKELGVFKSKIQTYLATIDWEDINWIVNAMKDPSRSLRMIVDPFWPRRGVYLSSLHTFDEIRDYLIRPQNLLPAAMFFPLLQAGIEECDPSDNKYFILPCVYAYGSVPVISALLDKVETGNDYEKAGAINALYWAEGMILNRQDFLELLEGEVYEKVCLLALRFNRLMLTTFISNPDVHVRQSALSKLELQNLSIYPEELRPLVEQAIAIARSHSDD